MESQFNYHGDTNTDVVIQVGEEPDMMTFLAHSGVLRKKSPYFYTALSSTWARREVLDILIAADELLIENDLPSSIQEHLIRDKSEWLQNHFDLVLHTVFERDACKELRSHCMDKICWDPNVVFKSPEFLDFDNILPLTLKNDIITFRESKHLPNSMLPPRNPIVYIDSNIILPQQAIKIPEWINQVQAQKKPVSVSSLQPGNEAIYDDPAFGPCFGKTDLDMRRHFNEKDNCSAKKRCYKHTIINSTKFAVEDYEVFQVFCHMDIKFERTI
ncbi:7442_t:CDS:2 [Dentiscutata erythropus]|uniref:7442_t:CDS:1 n=1 Tax=Dentiscutata erythropus TaxID=1348616 RepID=A0A9N9AWJ7_9GLOM|nr:7442_t:CDS:2 [Dentiscutata erythropus]